MNAPHPSLPAYVVEQTLVDIAELEGILADLGPRDGIMARVLAAQDGVKARSADIEASHGVPVSVDRASGSLVHHPAMADARAELRRMRDLLRTHDETTRKVAGLRQLLETGSKLDRPFRCHVAPSEIGRVAGEGRGLRLTAGPDGKPRIERVGTDRRSIPEVDGPEGVAKRRARSKN